MDAKELADQIYDTLSGNVGMSEYHIALDPEKIVAGEVNYREGEIIFAIEGKYFMIKVTEIPCPPYWEDENVFEVEE